MKPTCPRERTSIPAFICTAVLLATLGVCCTGCFVPVASARKAAVTHTPLPPAPLKPIGCIVLREGVESYNRSYEFIGRRAFGARDLVMLFMPMAMPGELIKVRGSQSLHTVLRSSIMEALQTAGYTALAQGRPKKHVPKKLRRWHLLEFDIVEFKYEYGAKGAKPNSHKIDLALRLLSPHTSELLWQKSYRILVKSTEDTPDVLIRRAMDGLLQQILVDATAGALFSELHNTHDTRALPPFTGGSSVGR